MRELSIPATVVSSVAGDIISIIVRNTCSTPAFTAPDLHVLLQGCMRAKQTLLAVVAGPNKIRILDFNTQHIFTEIRTPQQALILQFLTRTTLLTVDYFHARVYNITTHKVINELLVFESNRNAVVSGQHIAL